MDSGAPYSTNTTPPDPPARRWRTQLRTVLLGLQCKSTLLLVGTLLAVSILYCGLALPRAWSITTRLDSERALREAELIARFGSVYLADGREDVLQDLLDRHVSGDPLWFCAITDADGRIIASNDQFDVLNDNEPDIEKAVTPIVAPRTVRIPGRDGTYLHVTFPIYERSGGANREGGRGILGYVRLGLNRSRTVAEFDSAADLVIGIGLAIVLASVPLSFLVVRRIVAPLNSMSDTAQRFSGGDLSARYDVYRTDEIGTLAVSLNAMADQVAKKHREVLSLNEELEQRVLERTAQLRELASREPLTGLYNRRHIGEALAHLFAEAKRYRSDLSVMMIDMDDFKTVNDEHGHQVGDELLINSALTISSQLRSADIAGRYGGDEFIVLLPQTHVADARKLAARIVERFERDVRRKMPHVNVGISIGLASLVSSRSNNDEQLIRAADRALYEAKQNGKSRVASAGAGPQ